MMMNRVSMMKNRIGVARAKVLGHAAVVVVLGLGIFTAVNAGLLATVAAAAQAATGGAIARLRQLNLSLMNQAFGDERTTVNVADSVLRSIVSETSDICRL